MAHTVPDGRRRAKAMCGRIPIIVFQNYMNNDIEIDNDDFDMMEVDNANAGEPVFYLYVEMDKQKKCNFNSAIPLNRDKILRSITIIAELLAE